jgi:hypothetical protein
MKRWLPGWDNDEENVYHLRNPEARTKKGA